MAVNKQVYFLLHVVLISSVVNNAVSVNVPNLPDLRNLCRRFIGDFQELVDPHSQQFAVAIFQPGIAWKLFEYKPSSLAHPPGQKPVIHADVHLSPPRESIYNNYLAARPHIPDDAEIWILRNLRKLYDEYLYKNNNRPPHALLLYSFIVPCVGCTNEIIRVFGMPPFNSIPLQVVAHTTYGSNCQTCDYEYTRAALERAGIEFVQVRENPLIDDLLNQLVWWYRN